MKSYQRIGLVLLGAIAIGCTATPILWGLIQLARHWVPALRGPLDFPFFRVMSRVVLIAALVLFFRERKRLDLMSLAAVGLKRGPVWQRQLVAGWVAGAISLAALLVVMIPFGSRRPELTFEGGGELILGLLKALVTGLVVGCIEEIFFRGFILRSLLRDMRAWVAVVAMSALFALVHFLKAYDMPPVAAFDPAAGVRALGWFVQPLLIPSEVIPGFIGLFLVGVVLGCAALWTGSLYLSIGLHAGWVFGIKAESLFLDRSNAVAPWFFGDGKVVTGVAGWIMLLAMLAALRYSLPRPPRPLR